MDLVLSNQSRFLKGRILQESEFKLLNNEFGKLSPSLSEHIIFFEKFLKAADSGILKM